MHLANLADAAPFTTMDGSTIREVAGPVSLPTANQSLAEATVPTGGRAPSTSSGTPATKT